MKQKKLILILLTFMMIINLTGCYKKDDSITSPLKEKFDNGYTLDDGRLLILAYNPPYKVKESNVDLLGEAIFKKIITIDEVINNLNLEATAKDGGSKLYKYNKSKKIYGKENFYMIVCNSLDGVKNIYVAKNSKNLLDKCSVKINDIEEISMKVKENTLTNKGVTLIITDNSDRENIYGEDYFLQIYKEYMWVDLKTKNELAFNSIGYSINKGKSKEFKINWEYAYGKLKKGKYRILKSYSEPNEGTEHYVATEFTIK